MINKLRQKFIIALLIAGQFLIFYPQYSSAQATPNGIENFPEGAGNIKPSDPTQTISADDTIPADEIIATGFEYNPANYDQIGKKELANAKNVSSTTFKNKNAGIVILDKTDEIKMKKMSAVNDALPDLKSDIAEFARLTGISEEALNNKAGGDPAGFDQLVKDTEKSKFDNQYIKSRLKSNPGILATILGLQDATAAFEAVSSDPEGVNAAIDDILGFQIDKRVIQTLNYLVRPKDDPRGGAGHWSVKVSRIVKGYDRENNKYSRESKKAENEIAQSDKEKQAAANQSIESYASATDQSAADKLAKESGINAGDSLASGQIQDQYGNISDYLITPKEPSSVVSAHNSGQAVDISELDDIKCTVIQKVRVGSDSKTPKKPIGIKLQWQSSDGYSSDPSVQNSSMSNMFLASSRGAYANMLSELNLDIENSDSLEGADFNDLASAVGQAFLSSALDSPSGDIWKFDLATTLRKLGGIFLADNLQLERKPFTDLNIKSIDGLGEALGRYFIEQKLNLPYGALTGKNRAEIFLSAGRARLAQELHLPTRSLTAESKDRTEIYQHIGAALVEDKFGLTPDSLLQSTLADSRGKIGKYRLELLFNQPESIDESLGLKAGSTRSLKNGKLSPLDFDRMVAEAYFAVRVFGIPQTAGSDTSGNLRDELANLPEGTIDKFVKGDLNITQISDIGVDAIAKAFEVRDDMRSNFKTWLLNPSADYRVIGGVGPNPGETIDLVLPFAKYSEDFKLPAGDLYRIFGKDDLSRGVYRQLGEMMMSMSLAKFSGLEQRITETLNAQGSGSSLRAMNFYLTRVKDIVTRRSSLSAHTDKLKTLLSASDKFSADFKSGMDKNLADLLTASSTITDTDTTALALNAKSTIDAADKASPYLTDIADKLADDNSDAAHGIIFELNATNYELKSILRETTEIITGKEQAHSRLGDLKISEIKDDAAINLGGLQVSLIDLTLLFSGKTNIADFSLNLASAKLGNELNLPPHAFKYAALAVRDLASGDANLQDVFFRAFALAQMELASKQSNLLNSADIAQKLSASGLRDKIMAKNSLSQGKANDIVAASFGLSGYNLEYLMRGDFGAWSGARAKAEANDRQNHMPKGTTEKFIKGEAFGIYDKSAISDDEIREISTAMKISETALRTFIAVRDGTIDPHVDQVYFVDHNKYLSSPDTTACAAKAVPDNSFVYYDRGDDGKPQLHTFSSRDSAEKYKKEHSDRIISYIDEIEFGFAVLKEADSKSPNDIAFGSLNYNFANLDRDLKAFVADRKIARIFPIKDDTHSSVSEYAESVADISASSFDKIFTRGSATADMAENLDYLKTSGYYLLKNFAIGYLNDALGIDIGPAKLTPEDIYSIFNGNGRQVLAAIGSQYLDSELDLKTGTFQNIIDAASSAERNCNLMQVASQLLGNAIGIRGLDLGALFGKNDVGRATVEETLNLPRGSFKGATMDELINGLPIIDFYRAFQIPIPFEAKQTAAATMMEIGSDFYNSNKNKTFYEQAATINSYLSSLSDPAKYSGWHTLIDTRLKEIFLSAISGNAALWGKDAAASFNALKNNADYAGYADEELRGPWSSFLATLSSYDAGFGIAIGSSAGLLSKSAAMTPEKFVAAVQDKLATDNSDYLKAQTLVNLLGLGDSIKPVELQTIFAAIKSGDIGLGAVKASAYTLLTKIFSLHFDQKAGFTEGTFARLVANPGNAPIILLDEGAKRLDAKFGLSTADVNFSHLAHLWFDKSDDLIKADIDYCSQPGRDYATCIEARSYRDPMTAALAIGKEAGLDAATEWFWKYFKDSSVVTILASDGFHSGTTTTPIVNGATEFNQLKNEVRKVLAGDLRPLAIFGLMAGIGNMIGDEKGNLKVGANFLFSFEDIYLAIYGDANLEHYAEQAATQMTVNEWNANKADPGRWLTLDGTPQNLGGGLTLDGVKDGSGAISLNISDKADPKTPPMPGATALNGTVRPSSYEKRDEGTQFLFDQTDVQYGIDYQIPDLPGHSSPPGYTTLGYTPGADPALDARVIKSQQQARATARKASAEYYQYKTLDCVLHKADSNIPVGFSYAMFKQGSFYRTLALVNYFNNAIGGADGKGFFGAEGVLALDAFFLSGGPEQGNVETLLKHLTIDKIDQYLSEHIFGNKIFASGGLDSTFGFKSGTALAILKFVGSGNLDELKGLYNGEWIETQISGWFDTKLGLPAGTARIAYAIYQSGGISAFVDAFSMIPSAVLNGDILSAFSKELGISPEDAKMLGSFVTNYLSHDIDSKITGADIGQMALFLVKTLFAKDFAKLDKSLGLVSGSMMALASWGLMELFSFGNPMAMIATFVLSNMFGVYKQEFVCTADGYYPALGAKPDSAKWDVSDLGPFDATNAKLSRLAYMEAAQYKANKLVEDLYEMPWRTGDEKLVPTQVLTYRQEDIDSWKPLLADTVCKVTGTGAPSDGSSVCSGWNVRAGLLKADSPTVTHAGF